MTASNFFLRDWWGGATTVTVVVVIVAAAAAAATTAARHIDAAAGWTAWCGVLSSRYGRALQDIS